ncbi:hypothetical protein Tco_1456789 [Tanacetum coccineum]
MERELGAGYSFERKSCFVCGSLSHLIKDYDYYEKKMAREAALKSQRVVHADVQQATQARTNTHRSGASRFNTGKQHVNSGSVHVNSGTQNKSGGSRVNTGKQNVNSARVNRPVSNNSSPKLSQVNLTIPKKFFSKQRSPINRPFSRNTSHKSYKYAVKGKMGTAVKTSAGCVWRKVIPLSNTNSGPTPDSNVNVSRGPQGRPKPVKAWTATARTLADRTQQLNATIDSIEYTITEESVRRQLQLADASGVNMLQNEEIFAGLQNTGSKSGGWDQFGSNIATALICLSTGRDFNFSKLIFDGMISNLKGKSKFLMYPRFLQMILNIQTENKNLFVSVLLTKKIFGNMKRSFQGINRPLLPAMLTIDAGQPQPSAAPTPSQSIPTPTPSHVQIPTPPTVSITPSTQPPPIQPVQLTSPPPIQPLQPTSSPPITTILDIQPTHIPPSPHIPSPPHNESEGPSFEPSYHMSSPPSHEPEIQTSRSSEESEQLRNLIDLVPRLESRVELLEKELSDTKQTLGTAVLKLIKKIKRLENKLSQKRKREETMDEEDAEGQDQDIPSPTDQGNKFATPEKSKDLGEAQAEQISPSTLEAAQILTNVASEGFKGSQAPHGSKIYRRKPKSTTTPTKVLDFEEPAERLVNTGSTPTAQVNTAQVNTGSTPTAQVNTARVNTAELNTGETERVQRREGKAPMTEEDLQTEVQASKKSREQELQELAGLEAAQQLQATMDAETQRQIDLDALLARRLVEQEEEAAKEALATEFDYIQARLNADQILAEKIQQEEREQYSIEDRAKFLHDTIAAQRKFLAEQRYAAIRNKPPTISQLRNQMITYLKHVANKKHAELKSKSFEEIQVLYERYKKQDQTFVAIGSEEDERAIKKMNEQAADKEKEQKTESVHEEIKEAEGAKKRKLGTRRKLKAKRRKYTSGLTREDDDLKICLHIAPDEDKVVDVEILDHQYPIVEWQSFFLTTKPQHDPTKPLEDVYLNRVTRSNGHQRFFSTLMGVLSILDREDLKAVYELVMEKYQDEIPEGFDKVLWGDLIIMFNQGDTADFWDEQLDWKIISWKLHSSSGVHTIMTSNGLVIHMLVENRYPLTKEVLSQLLDLKLETEEESTMALELIKFVKQQLEEFEDSDDDDLAKSDHEEAERFWTSAKSRIVNNINYIDAIVAGKPATISKASIRSDLLFDNADGIDTLNNQAIFDTIQLMGGFWWESWRSLIKQLKKKARPVINHHKAWFRAARLKKQQKKKDMEKLKKRRSVSKQGRKAVKSSKAMLNDAMDYTQDGDTLVVKDKGNAEKGGNTKSTDLQQSTVKPDEGTAKIKEQVSRESDTPITPTMNSTYTLTVFGDDETIAQALIIMSQNKLKQKEKGIDPQKLNTNLMIKKKMNLYYDQKISNEVENNLNCIANDEEMARKVQEEWEAEEEKKRLAEKEATKVAFTNEYDFIHARLNADKILAEKLQEEKRKHSDLKTKIFEEILVLYENVKRSEENFITIGSVEDERLMQDLNKKANCIKKDDSIKEKSKEEKKKNDELRLCLTIAPDEDKEVDYEILDKKYPIIEWKSEYLGIKNLHYGYTKMRYLKVLTKYFGGDLMLMFNPRLVIHMLVEKKYPLRKKVLLQMLELKLESQEDSTMALELIRFVKKLIADLELENSDGNEEDL